MRTRILAVFAVLTALTLTACSDVVNGTGSEATGLPTSGSVPSPSTSGSTPIPTTGSPTTPAPTTSGGTVASADFSCPDITYAGAHMSFNCISNQMTVGTGGSVFAITMAQTVEPGSGWQMEMGAMRYEGTETSFPAISSDVRGDLLRSRAYGPSPTYDLDTVNYSTISGKRAYTTIDTVTPDPAFTASKKSAVKTEKRWLVIVEYEPGMFTTWFASIPDISQQFWAQVPASIASITINP